MMLALFTMLCAAGVAVLRAASLPLVLVDEAQACL